MMIPHLKERVSRCTFPGQAEGFAPADSTQSSRKLRSGLVGPIVMQLKRPHYSYASTPLKLEIANLLAWSNLDNCSRTEQPCWSLVRSTCPTAKS